MSSANEESRREHHRALERVYAAAPVSRWMGTSIAVDDGRAEVTLPVLEHFHHAAGGVHGSLYFRALDDAAFFAANSVVDEVLVLTSTFHVHFFRPVREGTLRAEGVVINRSRRLVTADSELVDDEGRVLGRGTGTFAVSGIRLDGLEGYADAG